MIDSFLIYPLLAGLGVAAIAGPLGTFVVWRRMAYFGETLSHSALLGVALGFLLNINLNLSVAIGCVVIALLLVWLQHRQVLATDTLLGILAHSALSLGLVVVSLLGNIRIDMMAYLFGDLLAVGPEDLFWIYGGGLVIIALLYTFWSQLLSITVHQELAEVEGINVKRIRLMLMLMIAVVIAVAMKIVGVLLITSLLIIPAATAQRLARSPEQMAIGASVAGMLSVCGGLWASMIWDTPTGPSVVVCSVTLFLVAMVLFSWRNPGTRP
ncbi:zinc ABC transporter permease subunit ZnuB [Parendozoicomonas haliclonae]|uniref:High-affinity zinc uptake system membrane protein ZnuB n=1 Tax=Parendozoicomonas haliclonae TaxID=1960125 RepID=A0A1X7AJB1_9GAMM|nr:zinc ABC transporter permease subunit ZnuB [Parendozoicomonas haliclonae]SMA46254.1 High-affinity zinc uptake system membrane protein ZnuB [Parendozoicomonas haliclonae]